MRATTCARPDARRRRVIRVRRSTRRSSSPRRSATRSSARSTSRSAASDVADEPRLPVPRSAGRALDRAAMERVLARAAELQMQSGDADPGDALTESQLLELGSEVGIAPDVLRRALAEEHTRVMLPEEAGLAARVAGPAIVGAARVVDGAPAAVLATIDAW